MKKLGKALVASVFSIALVVSMIGIAGCGTKESSNESTDIKVGLFEGSYLSVPVLVAKDKGYFEEEGLNVTWESVSDDGTTSVISGNLDVYCTGYNSALSAIAQGETSVKIIGGEMSEGCDYVAKKGFKLDSIKSAKDFEGLSIGVCMGDPGYFMTEAACQDAGVKADFKELDSIQSTITAVEKGEVDISIVCGAMSYDAISDGCKVLAKVSDITGSFPCCRLQANSNYIDQNPGTIQKFMRAALRGYETYVNNPDETCKILASASGQDEKSVKARMYKSKSYDTPMAVSIDPEANAVINADAKFKEVGAVEKSDIAVKDFIYVTAYQDALQSLIDEDSSNELWSNLMEQFKEKNSEVL